tara:strand:+ start:909 stop:1124 length:216 start_codon:yes stop_codon:yes gene_type:complete
MTKREIHYADGTSEIVDLTPEEETQRQLDEARGQEDLANEQAQKDLKASAKAKLIAGEPMTEEEANVLVGV